MNSLWSQLSMHAPSQPTSKEKITLDQAVYDYVVAELEASHTFLSDAKVPFMTADGEALSISQRVKHLVDAYTEDQSTIVVVNR